MVQLQAGKHLLKRKIATGALAVTLFSFIIAFYQPTGKGRAHFVSFLSFAFRQYFALDRARCFPGLFLDGPTACSFSKTAHLPSCLREFSCSGRDLAFIYELSLGNIYLKRIT
ncbi:hypothetical protein [Domibacillus enclensis]|uniref:Uncharacterized protein n=1 Tax=Domibacillus enclensis TaxID=1017273 RepID=A0A1N6NX84_9BACI|nr:hypothetical protein [Domibacillus enclensis]SIP96709.1 hypothetical protein SAMN05443094_101306 [Domibacillus enclensis]